MVSNSCACFDILFSICFLMNINLTPVSLHTHTHVHILFFLLMLHPLYTTIQTHFFLECLHAFPVLSSYNLVEVPTADSVSVCCGVGDYY